MYSMNCTAPDSEIHDESMDFIIRLYRDFHTLSMQSLSQANLKTEESLSQAETPAFHHAYDS
jgi:hypothetical protein